jgi:RNase P subunit RPR2
MRDTIQPPSCSKCEQPMAWHSDQEVHTRDGHALVQVFKCEACDRLKASWPRREAWETVWK